MSFTTDGSLGTSMTAQMANNWRLAYNRKRAMQGEEVASIERYTVSGADPAAGISGTETRVEGLADLAVFVEDMSRQYAESLGQEWVAGAKVFWFVPASAAQKAMSTDYLLWTPKGETSETRWEPTSIEIRNVGTDCLFCRVVAKRAPRP